MSIYTYIALRALAFVLEMAWWFVRVTMRAIIVFPHVIFWLAGAVLYFGDRGDLSAIDAHAIKQIVVTCLPIAIMVVLVAWHPEWTEPLTEMIKEHHECDA